MLLQRAALPLSVDQSSILSPEGLMGRNSENHQAHDKERPGAPRSKTRELLNELRDLLIFRQEALDWLLPPLAFLSLQVWLDLVTAAGIAIGISAVILLVRALGSRPILYALTGLVGVLIAIGSALMAEEPAGFLLPGIVSSGLHAGAALISILVKRPLVALASHLFRGWPLRWYWHPKIRPAYTSATLLWVFYFVLRGIVQTVVYMSDSDFWVTVVGVLGGWPASIVLLIFTYLYGRRRLARLDGPSVQEFQQDEPPPWQGQQRGF